MLYGFIVDIEQPSRIIIVFHGRVKLEIEVRFFLHEVDATVAVHRFSACVRTVDHVVLLNQIWISHDGQVQLHVVRYAVKLLEEQFFYCDRFLI